MLAARSPADRAIFRGIAEKALEQRAEEGRAQGIRIRNEIAAMLKG